MSTVNQLAQLTCEHCELILSCTPLRCSSLNLHVQWAYQDDGRNTLYYWWFVQEFAWIAAPLLNLLKKNNIELCTKKNWLIVWMALCDSVFQQLKNALTSESILIQVAVCKLFTIEMDASEWAIDCALMQNEISQSLSAGFRGCLILSPSPAEQS